MTAKTRRGRPNRGHGCGRTPAPPDQALASLGRLHHRLASLALAFWVTPTLLTAALILAAGSPRLSRSRKVPS